MILTCPSCGTRYQVDGAQFTPNGRNVRCVKCSHVWFQGPVGVEGEPEPEPERIVVPSAKSEGMAEGSRRSGPTQIANMLGPRDRRGRETGGRATIAGWLVLIGIVGGLAFALVQYRSAIAVLWPQSTSFYALVGLPVNVRGLDFSEISYNMAEEDGQPVLSVRGKLTNLTSQELPISMLYVELYDTQKRALYHWTFDAGVPTLAAGHAVQFMTRLSNPPAETRSLQVRFADIVVDASKDGAVETAP